MTKHTPEALEQYRELSFELATLLINLNPIRSPSANAEQPYESEVYINWKLDKVIPCLSKQGDKFNPCLDHALCMSLMVQHGVYPSVDHEDKIVFTYFTCRDVLCDVEKFEGHADALTATCVAIVKAIITKLKYEQ